MTNREKLKELLKELFRFGDSELDFGIYRIMNQKREEINKFIEEELEQKLIEETKKLRQNKQNKYEQELEKIKANAEELGVNYKETDRYKEIKDKLDSEEHLENIEAEIYKDIYTFFKRYYDNGDFISQRRYSKKNKYVIPYNGEEVYLYWANQDQYYIKTSEEFDNYSFDKNGIEVNFKVEQAQVDKNNNKSDENRYFLLKEDNYFEFDEENKILNIKFEYRNLTEDEEDEYNTRNTQRDIRNEIYDILKKKITKQIDNIYDLNWLITEENKTKSELKSHLYKYTTKNKRDYFIHKNLQRFLERELDFYIKNEIIDFDSIGIEEEKVNKHFGKVRIIKSICQKIIKFLVQIEDFQKKLFNKKKFVLDSEYCLTLDKVPEEIREEVFKEVLKNKEQLEEWKELYGEKVDNMNDLYLNQDNLFNDGGGSESLKNLVIDTYYFGKRFKQKLLSNFSNLDTQLNGLLLNSENYQALKLMTNKFGKEIQSIYIDPPFNKGKEANYAYRSKYKNSTWITLLKNRIFKSDKLLNNEGNIFVRCDYNGNMYVRLLLNNIFGKNNFKNEIQVNRISKQDSRTNKFNTSTDSLFLYSKSKNSYFNTLYKKLKKRKEGRWHAMDSQGQGKGHYIFNYFLEPPEGRHWTYGQENIKKMEKEKEIKLVCRECGYEHREGDWEGCPGCNNEKNVRVQYWLPPTDEKQIDSNWTDIPGYSFSWDFKTENSEKLLYRVIKSSSKPKDIVLDYFLGSGTTTSTAHKMDRKFIGIEMGEHFWKVIIPRMKKVFFYEESGITEKEDIKNNYNKKNSGGIFKYQKLEQYEDTIENIFFKDEGQMSFSEQYEDYILNYMLDYETKDSLLDIDKFSEPFSYKIEVIEDKEEKKKNVDLVETFNYLIGLEVNKIRVFNNQDKKYKIVKGKNNNNKILIVWRNTVDLDLEKDRDYIQSEIIGEDKYDKIYINGDNFVPNAILIEKTFKKKMFEDTEEDLLGGTN